MARPGSRQPPAFRIRAKDLDPDEVVLPVCPRCGRVGNQPISDYNVAYSCTGPIDESHKRQQMIPVRYVRADEVDFDNEGNKTDG